MKNLLMIRICTHLTGLMTFAFERINKIFQCYIGALSSSNIVKTKSLLYPSKSNQICFLSSAFNMSSDVKFQIQSWIYLWEKLIKITVKSITHERNTNTRTYSAYTLTQRWYMLACCTQTFDVYEKSIEYTRQALLLNNHSAL